MAQPRVRKAVLPVAGLGTRVLPGAKNTPKEMLNVVDRPIVSYIVAEARAAGIEHFVFVTGRGKEAIENYFDHHPELEAQLEAKGKADMLADIRAELAAPGEMSFVRQMAPLGLGHAIWCARDIIGDEPFAVLLPDVIVDPSQGGLKEVVAAYEATGANIIGLEEVPASQTHKYGVISHNAVAGPGLFAIDAMVEKPPQGTAPSNLSIAGRYVLRPEIFGALARHEKGAGGEIQLTDAMASLMQSQPFIGCQYSGVTYDCGDKIGLLRANVALALGRADLGADARRAIEALL